MEVTVHINYNENGKKKNQQQTCSVNVAYKDTDRSLRLVGFIKQIRIKNEPIPETQGVILYPHFMM